MRAIGRCAINISNAGERCINVLLELIRSKIDYVVQEAIIVIKVGAGGGVSCLWWCLRSSWVR